MRIHTLAAVAALASCGPADRGSAVWLDEASQAERTAYFTEVCTEQYGFKPGTADLSRCLQQENMRADQATQAMWDGIRANRPSPTNCSTVGGITNCTTH